MLTESEITQFLKIDCISIPSDKLFLQEIEISGFTGEPGQKQFVYLS
jgi:hypothetical protein